MKNSSEVTRPIPDDMFEIERVFTSWFWEWHEGNHSMIIWHCEDVSYAIHFIEYECFPFYLGKCQQQV